MKTTRRLAAVVVATMMLLGGTAGVADAKPKSPDGSSEWSEAKCDRVQRALNALARHIDEVEKGEYPYDGNNDALLVTLYALFNEVQRLHFSKCSEFTVVRGVANTSATPGSGTIDEPAPAGSPAATAVQPVGGLAGPSRSDNDLRREDPVAVAEAILAAER